MITWTGYDKIITMTILVTWFGFLQAKIYADPLPQDVFTGSGPVVSTSTPSQSNRAINKELSLNFWNSKNTPDPLSSPMSAEWIDDPGRRMQDPLFAEQTAKVSGTSQIDAEKKRQAKKWLLHSAVKMAEKTAFWKKIKDLEASVSDSLKFEYFKETGQKQGTTAAEFRETDEPKDARATENGIGFTISPKLDVDKADNLGVKADLICFDTIVNTEYQLTRNQFVLEFSNSSLNRYLDATASFGVTESSSRTAFVFKLKFDF